MGRKSQDRNLIVHRFGNEIIPQRVRDGYINATALCKAARKLWSNYYQLKGTKEFLAELSLDLGIPRSKMVQTFTGRPAHLQGTWVHPEVAMDVAQWCSPKLRIRVNRWVLEWTKTAATRDATIERFLSPTKREWAKTFSDDLWREFARLTGHEGSIHNRPKWWGHLVNELIYDLLEPDVAAYLRENMPKPQKGQNYHQYFTRDYGLPKLNDHIQRVIGIAQTCQTIGQLQEKMRRIYGDQLDLNPPMDDPDLLWDGDSVQ